MRPYGPAALRLCVGSVFLLHGLQKLFGLAGGAGVAGTAKLLADYGLPFPTPLAVTLGAVEAGGGLLLVIGAATLWVSLLLLLDMAFTVWRTHYPHGLAVGHLMPASPHDAEFYLVVIGALFCLMLAGPGVFSIDDRRAQNAEAQARGRARMRKV
jgi:putative oxidoreductase